MTDYVTLSLSLILIAFSFLLIERQNWLMRTMRVKGAGYLMFFLLLLCSSGFMAIASTVPQTTIFPMNVISNTVYQNTNTVNLYIYATASGGVQSFLGVNNTNLGFIQSSGSQTLVVPAQYYFQFNYSGTYTAFSGEVNN